VDNLRMNCLIKKVIDYNVILAFIVDSKKDFRINSFFCWTKLYTNLEGIYFYGTNSN
jgi:hypothetical protein